MTSHPHTKAVLVTGLFTIFGLAGWFLSPQPSAAWTQAVLYGLLMVHTWFSVRLFFGLIDPKDARQQIINVVLVVAYAGLAWSMRSPLLFYFVWTSFFTLTVLKYVLLIGRFEYRRLLRRKLIADVSGIGLGILMVALLAFWPNQPWHNLAIILFGFSCVYYLFLCPLYDAREQV